MAQLTHDQQQHLAAEKQDLPFACFQQPTALQQQQQQLQTVTATGQQQNQPMQQHQQYSLGGVCILRQEQHAGQASSSIDVEVLRNAGLKIRPSSSCIPDMIISAPALPAPLAVIVAQASAQSPGSNIDNADFLQRCASMANTSRLSCVLVPHTLATHPAVLDIACGSRFSCKVMLQHYVPQQGAAACILQLAHSLASANAEKAAIAEQHLAAVTSEEALQACMVGLAACDPALPSPEQLQELLARCYGSLHQLVLGATAEDIAACIGCSLEQGQRLWWLFGGIEA